MCSAYVNVLLLQTIVLKSFFGDDASTLGYNSLGVLYGGLSYSLTLGVNGRAGGGVMEIYGIDLHNLYSPPIAEFAFFLRLEKSNHGSYHECFKWSTDGPPFALKQGMFQAVEIVDCASLVHHLIVPFRVRESGYLIISSMFSCELLLECMQVY